MASNKAPNGRAMELITHTEQDLCIIKLKGELDLNSVLLLDEGIEKVLHEGPAPKKLYVDCQGLHYISSAGLGVFIDYLSEIEAKHIALVFYGMSCPVRDIFSILGLDAYVTIVASEEEAHVFCQNYGY